MTELGNRAMELEEAGVLTSYDFALPQDWFNRLIDMTGANPAGHVVWSYKNSLFGRPVAITMYGHMILQIARNMNPPEGFIQLN